MTSFDELEDAREDLEALLLDVLGSVLGEEAYPIEDGLAPGPVATSTLSIHDELTDVYLGVEVRVGAVLARLLASRMMAAGDPSPDDLLDAVGELGNIAGGNVKSLLFHTARLSLPTAELTERADDVDEDEAVSVRAAVLGQVAELVLTPGSSIEGLYWPPKQPDEILESQS